MKTKPIYLKWVFCAIPFTVALLLYFLLPLYPAFTEYVMAQGLFRIFGFPLQWMMSVLPFSFAEIVVVLLLPGLLVLAVIWTVRIIKSTQRRRVVEKGVRFAAWCVSLLFLVYMLLHGANYYRLPLGTLLALPEREYTAEDLYTVACDLADKASEARKNLPEDKNGCATFATSLSEILKDADDCYKNLQKEYPFLKTGVQRVKPVAMSHLWSYTGTTGMYTPWSAEANVNIDVPAYSLPHTAAHEIAHAMGIAKENECNFIAYLACITSEKADFVYSGYLAAYTYCVNSLYHADRELYKAAYTHCSAGVLRDLDNEAKYWDSFEGKVMDMSQHVNDTFIKVNGDEKGVLSYSDMVALVLRYYDVDVI